MDISHNSMYVRQVLKYLNEFMFANDPALLLIDGIS